MVALRGSLPRRRTVSDPIRLADQLLGDFMAGLSSVTP